MQGRNHQVACDRGLHGNRSSLLVSDLTDHDDIRVLTQNGAQGRGKRQVRLVVGLHLIDAVDIGLHRVLYGDDVHILLVQLAERRVQSGGLTTSCRPRHQQDPVRMFQNMVKLFQFIGFQAELALFLSQRVLGGKTHNDLLSVDRRQNGYTDIKLLPVYDLGDTTVLRLSLLGNIHTANNLDTCHDRRQKPDAVNRFLVESAVDTVTYPHLLLHRFDMNIGSTLSDGLIDHALDQLYNGGVVDILTVHILLLDHLAFFFSGILLQRGIYLRLPIILVYRHHHTAHGSDYRLHLQIRDDIDIVHSADVHGIRHSHSEHVHVIRRIFDGNRPVLLKDIRRHKVQNFLRDLNVLQIHHIVMELITQRSGNILLGGNSLIHQRLAQLTATAFLPFQTSLQVRLRDNAILHKHVSQTHFFSLIIHNFLPAQTV